MARKKGSKQKEQPAFCQSLAAIALDFATAADDDENAPPPQEEANAPKKTVFEQILDAMDPLELRALLDECMAASLVPKEHLGLAVLRRLNRMTQQ